MLAPGPTFYESLGVPCVVVQPGRLAGTVWEAISELHGVIVLITADQPAAELFDTIGPRLRDRLGDVVVLPSAGRQAWLRRFAASEQRFRGQHGGLDEAETNTYLAQLTR